jgi:subtilisin-like proprotein convertase family protein
MSDLPHRGIVDHYRSFYRITQLTPGKRYTVWMTGLEDNVDLFAGNLVLQEDRVSQSCVRGSSSGINLDDEWCTFVATQDYVDVEVTDYYGHTTSSKLVLSAFEDFDSEGSPAAPAVLAYAGGVTHAGHVGPQVKTSDPPAMSYYQVTGLTPSANYLIALTDFGGGTPWLYSDAAFSTAISCANSQSNSCEFNAPGSSIYLVVPSWVERSRQFTLHVRAATVDQGSFTQPMALSYLAFPYSGQARNHSEYLVSGLPPGPLEVTLSPLDAPLQLDAWSPTGGLIDGGDFRFPRATIAASAAGELRVRVDDGGRFAIDLRPAPGLTSQYTRVSGRLAIPDGNATGLSDALTVSGSPVTAISRVTVELYVKHGEPQELTFVLVSPGGTEVQLVKESVSDFTTVRDRYEGVIYDDFALAHEAGFLGDTSFTRRPRRPLHLLTGQPANGTWTLRVIDTVAANYSDDTGELLGWGLSFH